MKSSFEISSLKLRCVQLFLFPSRFESQHQNTAFKGKMECPNTCQQCSCPNQNCTVVRARGTDKTFRDTAICGSNPCLIKPCGNYTEACQLRVVKNSDCTNMKTPCKVQKYCKNVCMNKKCPKFYVCYAIQRTDCRVSPCPAYPKCLLVGP